MRIYIAASDLNVIGLYTDPEAAFRACAHHIDHALTPEEIVWFRDAYQGQPRLQVLEEAGDADDWDAEPHFIYDLENPNAESAEIELSRLTCWVLTHDVKDDLPEQVWLLSTLREQVAGIYRSAWALHEDLFKNSNPMLDFLRNFRWKDGYYESTLLPERYVQVYTLNEECRQ